MRKCKAISNTIYLVLSLTLLLSHNVRGEELSFKEYLEKANEYIKAYRHFEASDALKEATRLGGDRHPSLHMRLAILYYGLGLLPEAITEGEKAVSLAPASKWYKYDLAKFYFVDKQYDKAEEMFTRLLQLDPGFTFGYYYLAELFFQKKEYDMAWLSLQRAKRLGHRGTRLEKKLNGLTSKPSEDFTSGDNMELFRFIKVDSAEKAREILDMIWNGRLFENLELELKKDKTSSADFGVMVLGELKESVASSLRDTPPYSEPLIIRTGPDYRIMQRIAPFHPEQWRQLVKLDDKTNGHQPQPTSTGASALATAAAEPETVSPPVAQQNTEKKQATEIRSNEIMAAAGKIPPPSPGAPELFSSKLAAYYALEEWKDSWAAQDVESYLAAYSENFVPPRGMSRSQWEKNRRRSLSKPKFIKIQLEDPVVEMLGPQQLLATFKQSYHSNTYQDVVIKTLTMAREADGWKIIRERVIEKIR